MNIPRILLAALKGGSGKTLITVGLTAALRKKGLSTSVFKKGPDYIDAGWLSMAAGRPCYNLDQYLFSSDAVLNSFATRSGNSDIAIIEGNRGVFDGIDSQGSSSSAELAKLLRSPTVIIIDCMKMTGTTAALIKGCQEFDPELRVEGIILNRIRGTRHEKVVRESIKRVSAIPVVGVVPAMTLKNFPQRHLGLLPIQEHPAAKDFVEEAASIADNSIDLDQILRIAQMADDLCKPSFNQKDTENISLSPRVRIGVLKDSAFQFYYPENIEALTSRGADIIEISALESRPLPTVDALYIGGGFPETNAQRLADNLVFKDSVRLFVEHGGPVYAECGGLMFLAKTLVVDNNEFPMAGIFPASSVLNKRPQGLGYVELRARASNAFFRQGQLLRGHEFHYSTMILDHIDQESWPFDVLRGHGVDGAHDGLQVRNALGTYAHVHALSEPSWADAMIRKAREFHKAQETNT
jgi:cobyrinic acid a,c-diamide synthase